ncbi:efflux transporter [Dichomitus squalens LYAD-421 SS1]|uniref:Efflux transporter n=1 Tax=Dichomitus squalens (strain LYAD-421) TaxID=732165 RepID=R7SJU3_DICSQ|nr:efflux transporter [Dichomitus squalens LYAD-421 SS1]EJF56000.1 efflux transporter [Dichomitus squalens LYAD-421 SS1]
MSVHSDTIPTSPRSLAEKPRAMENDDTLSPTNMLKDNQHLHTRRSMSKDIILIATVTLAMLLNTANLGAAAISLPTIGRDLNISEAKLQWIISAYSLSSGCLLLFLGRLADLFGRKIVFIGGCACMAIFGLGCGFAQNSITIYILRGLQGLGPAASVPAALGILAHTFPPSPIRSIAFATFSAGAPVGAAVGLAIGGVLTQLTAQSWRSTFWFLTGLSALCCLGGLISIEADVPYALPDKRIDWLGAFLITAGLVFVVFALSDGPIAPDGWKTGYIIALLIVGVFLIVLFVLWERLLERLHAQGGEVSQRWWTPPPLMPVSIWGRANGKLAAMLIVAFVSWCSFNSFTFWVQLYYQDYVGLSPILTMVRLLPMAITGVLCNVIIAVVVGRAPLVFLVGVGTLLTGTANLLFAVIVPSAPYWAFGFPAAIIGVFGADFVFSTGTLFIARVCLPHEQSVGGALFQTLTQLGTAFGLAISTVVFNATQKNQAESLGVTLNQGGTNAPKSAQLTAYKDAMWSGFAFGLFGFLLTVLFLRGVGPVGHRKADSDDESEKTALEPADRGSGAINMSD